MIGGWLLYMHHQISVMFGNAESGFLIKDESIFAMIAGIISERNFIFDRGVRYV